MQLTQAIYNIRFVLIGLLMPFGITANAQNVVIGTCRTTIIKSNDKKHETVSFHIYKNKRQAENARNILKTAATAEEQPDATGNEWNNAITKLGITWSKSRPNGQFKFEAFEGQAILVHYTDNVIHLLDIVNVEKGKTEYQIEMKDEKSLRDVEVRGKNKFTGPRIKKVPGQDNGFEVSLNVNLELPEGWAGDNSRLIIQPMAIDCQTEDTVSYLTPLVYEGAKYHELQDKRMAFDYDGNDSLAQYYHPSPVLNGQYLRIDTQVVFRKPDKDKTYKGVYYAILEDYHHVYYNNGGEGTGSCLSFRPLKFLDFTMAAEDIPLTEEFKENAEQRAHDVTRTLNIKFVTGKSELTPDSANMEEFGKMGRELKSYGNLLFSVKVTGSSSPEGSRERNAALARERTNFAAGILRRAVRGQDASVSTETKIFTWENVVTQLAARDTTKASMLNNLISGQPDPNMAYPQIKNLPFYESDIEPILASMRNMKCSYQYIDKRVLTPEEAVETYYTHKKDFISGAKDDLSDGDFYNLFNEITDSAEVDTLTMIAYRHMVRQDGYEVLKMSPYIANKMALLNIRRGMPDLEVLRPFIDWKVQAVDKERHIDAYTSSVINRHEILINQAIQYFQELKLDTAETLIDFVGSKTVKSAQLSQVLFFVRNIFLGIGGQLDGDDAAKFEQAFNMVLNTNKDNRAILFSELHESLGKTRKDVEPIIDKMDDNNPKKWYLKGIIWSKEAGKEPKIGHDDTTGDDLGNGFRLMSEDELSIMMITDPKKYAEYNLYVKEHPEEAEALRNPKQQVEDDGIKLDSIPHYLAYFQHSFDIEPKYKRYYFNEGNIPDETRKIYKYKKKNIPAYRKLFKLLMEQRETDEQSGRQTTGEGDKPETTKDENDNGTEAEPETNEEKETNTNEK